MLDGGILQITKILLMQVQNGKFLPSDYVAEDGREKLRQNGGKCRTGHAHLQGKNENHIQNDIQKR